MYFSNARTFNSINNVTIQRNGLATLKEMSDDSLLREFYTAQQEWKEKSNGTPSSVNRIVRALANRARQAETNNQDANKWWSKKREAESLLRVVRLRESPDHDETVHPTEMAEVMKHRG